MTGSIFDEAFTCDELLFNALERLGPDEVDPFVSTFLEQLTQAGRQVADRQKRDSLRGLLFWWAGHVEGQTGDFPDVWLQPADGQKKKKRTKPRDLPHELEELGSQLQRKIREHTPGKPAAHGEGSGRKGPETARPTGDVLRHHTDVTRSWTRIERLLNNGEIDRVLVKLAGMDGCQAAAARLIRLFELCQAQLRLGMLTHRQAEALEAKIAAAIRRVLGRAIPIS